MMLNSEKLLEYVNWQTITKDTVTLNMNGEQLKEEIYNDLKAVVRKDPIDEVPTVFSQDAPFIKIYPDEIYNEEFCEQLALELCNRLNKELEKKLGIK